MVWEELIVVLLVVGLVVAISGSPGIRSALLTLFGVLGLLSIGVSAFWFLARSNVQERIERIDFEPSITIETTPAEKPAPTVVAAKKRGTRTDSTSIEELPIQPAEPIRIDEQLRAEIEQQWREAQLHDRLLYTGTAAGTLLCLLATLFGYLKLDLLSQARHRHTLQAGAAGVILAVALVAALAAEGRLGF